MSNKIGIITFHNAINYGAALQSFASQQFLNNSGIDAEVVDYHCTKFANDYKTVKVYSKSIKGVIKALIKAPNIYKKNRKFKEFVRKYIRLSKPYNQSNISQSNTNYAKFIVGSDQVWNLRLTDADINYLLHFVKDNRIKYSYAASMGSTALDEKTSSLLRKEIGSFASISVREEDARDYLSDLLGRDVQTVLDPVFLLSREEWDKVAQIPKDEDYILVYCLHEQDVYFQAERLAKKTGLKIKCIQNNIKKPIKAGYVLNAGPSEFVGFIKNAKYIVTDSFHGATFGIIYRKQIKVVLKKSLAGLNNRLLTILNSFELTQAIVDDQVNATEENSEITYNEELIEGLIAKSRQYLLRIAKEQN